MNFLIKADFEGKISSNILEQITGGDDLLLDSAEKTAKGIITDLLSGNYDLDVEFDKEPDSRHDNLLNWMLNLSTYLLYDRIPDDEIPERVVKDYDDTMDTLIQIARGKTPTTLTPIEVEEGVSKRNFRMGSNEKRNHKML